jgi:hypothetical protein
LGVVLIHTGPVPVPIHLPCCQCQPVLSSCWPKQLANGKLVGVLHITRGLWLFSPAGLLSASAGVVLLQFRVGLGLVLGFYSNCLGLWLLVLPNVRPVRLAYQPPGNSTFLSQQTSHQQSASSTFLSEQISTSHQPPAKRTVSLFWCSSMFFFVVLYCRLVGPFCGSID